MVHQLNFATRYQYRSIQGGVSVPVELIAGRLAIPCEAKIDTGAEYCLFERDLAESLGLELERGHALHLETLTGSLLAYGHEVELRTLGLSFLSTVYFAADYSVSRNLLGRNGWLNLVLLGLNAYDETLYLSAYDDLAT